MGCSESKCGSLLTPCSVNEQHRPVDNSGYNKTATRAISVDRYRQQPAQTPDDKNISSPSSVTNIVTIHKTKSNTLIAGDERKMVALDKQHISNGKHDGGSKTVASAKRSNNNLTSYVSDTSKVVFSSAANNDKSANQIVSNTFGDGLFTPPASAAQNNDANKTATTTEELENTINWLKSRLHEADKQITSYKKDLAAVTINFELAQEDVLRMRKMLDERDEEIRNLRRIKDVYQSVMRGTGILPSTKGPITVRTTSASPDASASASSANLPLLKESPVNKGQQMLKRAVDQTTQSGISKLRESFALKFMAAEEVVDDYGASSGRQNVYSTEKDFSTKEMLKKALLKNDLLQEILHTTGPSVTSELIHSMYKRTYTRNDSVIVEGEPADALFVLTAGKLEIQKAGKVLGTLEPAKAFGEIGIIYKCTRTASVIAISDDDTVVWTLDRQTYQKIIVNAGRAREEELLQIIRHVPILQSLDEQQLRKVATALDTEYYTRGAYIIRQGEAGDTFFILNSGQVEVLQIRPGLEEPKVIRELGRGQFFGEKALLREDKRSASVIAKTDCECLTLERKKFLQLIPAELFDNAINNSNRKHTAPIVGAAAPERQRSTATVPAYGDDDISDMLDESETAHLRNVKKVDQLTLVSVIGRGGFGKVYLVENAMQDASKEIRPIYALKLLSKHFIISERQFEHIKWEKDILFDMRSPFIVRLYTSFMDAKYIYLLMEICQGGDLFQRLKQCGRFEYDEAQFHSACVVSALQYIHNRGIAYRDLKPENCVMDSHGYTKIVDFGFAKEVLAGKTYTFCGTPQYLAPELIIGSGHDIAVDYWALGILMFELTSGCSPFYFAGDIYQLYLDILDGIERVEFPRDISLAARDLIRRLCRKKPTDRIGYGFNGVKQIKKHKYFQAFDWAGLKLRSLKPPFVPPLTGLHDTSHFRHVKTRLDELNEADALPPDDFSEEWEKF